MKALIIAATLLSLSAPVAFAQTSTSNSAVIGAQVNEQNGYYNSASNAAAISQSATAVGATPYFPFPSGATATNSATVGAQINTQNGAFNSASNGAFINQSTEAAGYDAHATTTNTATIGAQVNSQFGVGNSASNQAAIDQSGLAVSTSPVLMLEPVFVR